MTPGIDCSNNNGPIDFDAVAGAGYQFAYIKVSEGISFSDAYFPYNWSEAKRVGMVRGAYHFARPDYGYTPDAELAWFIQCLGGAIQPGDFIVLDAEKGVGNTAAWYLRWLQLATSAFGFAPMLYSGRWFMDPAGITNNAAFADYGLILAAYQATQPAVPAPWDVLAMWQHSDTGSVPGLTGACDLDLFNGTIDRLKAYGKPQPAPQPARTPTNDDLIYFDKLLCAEPPQLALLHSSLEPFLPTPA